MLLGQSYSDSPNLTTHRVDRKPRPAPAPAFPDELTRRPQWTGYKFEPRDGKRTKVLKNPRTGENAKSNDHTTWGTYAAAVKLYAAGKASGAIDGIGFVLSTGNAENPQCPADPYVVIDIDDCIDIDGNMEPWAREIVTELNTHTDISTSGTGLHLIGRGKKIADRCRNWKHPHGSQIEIYEHVRFITMSGNVLPGYETIRDIQAPLDAFITAHWIDHQSVPHSGPAWNGPSLESHKIVEKLSNARNSAKFRALYEDGDTSAYGGDHSAADSALCCLIAFHTKDPAQILEIWRSSGLYRPKTDREDYAESTITNALEVVGNAGYDPDHPRGPRLITPPPAATDPDLEGKSADELRAIIRQQTAIIAAEHAARIAAEERADTLAIERSGIMHILRNGDLGAERLTGFAIALDLHARIANGEQPAPAGFKAPAKRYAEMTGQSEGTVAKHMRLLSKDPKTGEGKDLIPKRVVRERTDHEIEGETIDHSTGEIRNERETVRGLRDVNYVSVPEGRVINLIDRLRTYQRPEGEIGHGGKRESPPVCEHHPDAGTYTVKQEHVECAACHAILETCEPKRTYRPAEDPANLEDESTGIKMTPVTPTVVNVLSGIKMTPELAATPAADGTDSIMQPEPAPGICADCGERPAVSHDRTRCAPCAQRMIDNLMHGGGWGEVAS